MMEVKGKGTIKLGMAMVWMLISFVMLVEAADGHDLAPTPQSSPSAATIPPLVAPSPLLATSAVDFGFKKFGSLPGLPKPRLPEGAKNGLKKTACPAMCAMFCVASGGPAIFAMCSSPCLLQCFLVRGMTSVDVVPECTLGCVKGLAATYGLDADQVGGYMETCYNNCRKY